MEENAHKKEQKTQKNQQNELKINKVENAVRRFIVFNLCSISNFVIFTNLS